MASRQFSTWEEISELLLSKFTRYGLGSVQIQTVISFESLQSVEEAIIQVKSIDRGVREPTVLQGDEDPYYEPHTRNKGYQSRGHRIIVGRPWTQQEKTKERK
eukprot:3618028-Amphidinium_carterae.1